MILPAIIDRASVAVRYREPEYPSQWMSREYVLTAACGTDVPGPFDVWRNPVNVGIVDAYLEPRRGIYVQKCVQSGVSTYMQGLMGYLLSRRGGSFLYVLAKLDTMRKHALTRVDPMIQGSPELRQLLCAGRDGHETILDKTFVNGSLVMTSAASENNFISVPYSVVFLDEFDKMGIFPSGNDAVQLAFGRQKQQNDPRLIGFSTCDHPERGICAYVANDSDVRRFFVRCPHCGEVIYFDFLRDVQYDYDGERRIPSSARLTCYRCSAEITDSQRATAILHAAQAACQWYTDVPFDGELGWVTTLDKSEADAREFVGFCGYSLLYNIRTTVRDMAREFCACRTEAQLKVFYNDSLGEGYAMNAQVLQVADVMARQADNRIAYVPDDTAFVTVGVDVQGGGADGDLVFYFDLSAWRREGFKSSIDIDRMRGTKANGFRELVTFVTKWAGKDRAGGIHNISGAVIDAGWQTKTIYRLCNEISPPGSSQWAFPVIYSREKLGAASYIEQPQGEGVGDVRRRVWLASRDWLVSRAIDRVVGGRVELPNPLKAEIAQHYVANIQVEDYDRHGNFRGWHWAKKQVAKGQRLDDDWLQAAAYTEFAAILLGLDTLDGSEISSARAAADEYAARRNANRDKYRLDRSMVNRAKYKKWRSE